MSDKKISQFNELTIANNSDLIPIVDVATNETKFIQKQNLGASLVSQTVTNGVTTKSPSEDAVFDAIYAKGLVKNTVWKNNGVGTFTLEADKYNIVVYSNTNIEIFLPAVEVDKTIIVQGTTQNGSGAVNFTINNIKIGGADLGTPYSVTVTNEKEVLIFYGNYYGWHLIGHSNKTIDLSTKLDLDGGNANQDIDIDGFGVNAKHFKVNGTGGAGHIGLKHQSANISASASESSIGADSVGDPVWKNDGGAIDKLELQSNKTGTVTGNEASTSKYLTVKGVYDWAVGLFAPKASPTFTGTVTTPDIIVSNATGSTPAFFDAVDKLISTTAQLWGTWVQTWASKATPVDADTIGFYNSASTFVGVKSTLLNFWTAYLLPKVQALAYLSGTGITTNNIPYFNGTSLVNSQLTRSATSIDSSVKLTGNVLGTGGVDGIPTLANAGDFVNIRLNSFAYGIAMNMRGAATNIIKAYDARNGWTHWANTGENPNLKHWNGQEITSGNTPTGALGGNTANQYTGYYSYEIHDRQSRHIRGYFYVNSAGVPSNLIQTKQESSGLSIAITGSPAKVVVTNSSAIFARITTLETQDSTTPPIPEFYELYSNDAQTRFFTGTGGLGVGHTSQNASAILQADSTTKGFLPPRMTNAQRTSIASPAIGLMVYCTDATEGLYIYKSTGWTFII